MNKNELRLAEAELSARKFEQALGLVKHALSMASGVGALWVVFDGLHRVLYNQGPDGIVALSKVIEALSLGSWIGYAFGGGMFVAWKRERAGKKRAIREKSRYQKQVEATDPYRSGSGLTETGETPQEEY